MKGYLGIIASQGQNGRIFRARQQFFNFCQRRLRGVQHNVFRASGLLNAIDPAEEDFQGVRFFGRELMSTPEQDGGTFENGLNRAELIGFER